MGVAATKLPAPSSSGSRQAATLSRPPAMLASPRKLTQRGCDCGPAQRYRIASSSKRAWSELVACLERDGLAQT